MCTSTLGRNVDIHNTAVDERLADDGYCGTIHLPTGRVCMLAARHRGGCEFTSRRDGGQPNQPLPRR